MKCITLEEYNILLDCCQEVDIDSLLEASPDEDLQLCEKLMKRGLVFIVEEMKFIHTDSFSYSESWETFRTTELGKLAMLCYRAVNNCDLQISA